MQVFLDLQCLESGSLKFDCRAEKRELQLKGSWFKPSRKGCSQVCSLSAAYHEGNTILYVSPGWGAMSRVQRVATQYRDWPVHSIKVSVPPQYKRGASRSAACPFSTPGLLLHWIWAPYGHALSACWKRSYSAPMCRCQVEGLLACIARFPWGCQQWSAAYLPTQSRSPFVDNAVQLSHLNTLKADLHTLSA